MKYNQYAYVETDFDNQVRELIDINFLPRNYEDWSFSDLLAKLVKNAIAEAKTDAAKSAKLSEFAVSDHETLTDFLKQKPESIGTAQFYNVALQLLGYHVHYDYDFADPTGFMQKTALPFVQDINDTHKLISAFYRLLNTRTKNGQILLDVMAGKGYFTQFWGQNQFKFFNGKSIPVFDTSKVIREVVYVETDLDTDHDGKSDLIQVTVFRPVETNNGLKVPALYTASPYFGGIIANEKRNHSVDENLSDATEWNDPQYVHSPIVKAEKPDGSNHPTTEEAVHKSSYPLNEYMLARGFASVFAGAIGTRGSDGVRITGAPEETESAAAVIEWLHGDRIAYTDRTRTMQTKADWCNGNIGMTGRSYLGTLQIAIAT
ncbi:CocE/NonD family hydrolase, partial [Lactobacillus acidophilus]